MVCIASLPRVGSLASSLFVNVWARRAGGLLSYQVEPFTDIEAAAIDAASPSLYAYAGTLVADLDGTPRLVDLADLGAALVAERRRDRKDEARHERSLKQGAGRIVL